jgi:glycosyltransferase involved in cell wall biosynthesis
VAETPRVSVVIEGYNESLALGSVEGTIAGLRAQDFPLDCVEVILVGSSAQARRWQELYGEAPEFAAVTCVAADGAHYFELKNSGIEAARGEVVALTDSDARPEPGWLQTVVEGIECGADMVVGPSLFRGEARGPADPLMLAAASVSWGGVVGRDEAGDLCAASFQSHNVGFSRAILERHRYRTDLGRTCAGWFLYKQLAEAGARIVFQPGQRVAHTFSAAWWGPRLHVRFGYEALQLRRLDEDWPRRWLRRTAVLEPLLTTAGRVVLDLPNWIRVSEALGLPRRRRLALAPVVVGLSLVARTCELAGMYATLAAPQRMKRFAHSN